MDKKTQHNKNVSKNTSKENNNMSTETTKPAASKLPNKIYFRGDDDKVEVAEIEQVIGAIVENGELTDQTDFKAAEIAKTLLINNLKSLPQQAELPAQFEDFVETLDKANEIAFQVAQSHVAAKQEIEEKNKLDKEAKAAEKAKIAEEKEAKAKEFAKNEEVFGNKFMSAVSKFTKQQENFVDTLTANISKGMPKSIAMTDGGMGMVVSEGASRDDIAVALANSITTFGSLESAKSAIQFQIGDLLNKAVEKGVYPKKSDAASHIRVTVMEKCGKNWSIEHVQACALMAERVPVEKRLRSVNPSTYLAISKLTPPRAKGALTEATEQQALEVRSELIEKVNSGELNSKNIKAATEKARVEAGWKVEVKDDSARINELKGVLFWANFLISIAINGKVKTKRSKDTQVYEVSELEDKRDEAQAELTQLLVGINYNVEDLASGTTTIEKNGKKEDVAYFISDPFWSPRKAKEEKEAAAAEVATEEAEASEEAASEEEVDF